MRIRTKILLTHKFLADKKNTEKLAEIANDNVVYLKIQKLKLEELSNEMFPYVFEYSKTMLEFKRSKAIWAIVLYELDKVNLKLKM